LKGSGFVGSSPRHHDDQYALFSPTLDQRYVSTVVARRIPRGNLADIPEAHI
jgi:hypothetical protein